MGGAPADGSQGTYLRFAYDYGVGSVIKLLEKGTRSYGQKKTYKLSADTSFGKVIFTIIHFDKPHK
ncbi:MAG: hypothetical protein ACLU5K_03495 [Christensenellales bacterium]